MWDSNTPPSCPGLDIWSMKFAELDICGWPNNNHKIGSDTILELSGPNSTPVKIIEKKKKPPISKFSAKKR